MKFDEKKVYTALTADVVKIGSIGYAADCLVKLKKKVEQEQEADINEFTANPSIIAEIRGRDSVNRFKLISGLSYNLFYLIKEPEEKKLRPYKDINEMIDNFTGSRVHSLRRRPMIWVRNKNSGSEMLICGYYKDDTVLLSNSNRHSLFELSEYYEYLDGSPCGVEE